MTNHEAKNNYPIEVEEYLSTHPDIYNVQVVSVPDPEHGEELMAWIILDEGKVLTEDAVRDFCEGNLPSNKIPKYFEFTDEYPMTASGKIMKFKLLEMAVDKISE